MCTHNSTLRFLYVPRAFNCLTVYLSVWRSEIILKRRDSRFHSFQRVAHEMRVIVLNYFTKTPSQRVPFLSTFPPPTKRKGILRLANEEETMSFPTSSSSTTVAFADGTGVGKLLRWTQIFTLCTSREKMSL